MSADYLLGLSNTPTTNKNIQFICDYTGLEENTIEELRKGKDSIFYTTLLNFLLNNNILLKSLNNYLLSSIYIEYKNASTGEVATSDIEYIPCENESETTKCANINIDKLKFIMFFSKYLQDIPEDIIKEYENSDEKKYRDKVYGYKG